MQINGACHCGDITYEADVDPDPTRMCHCTDCQTMSGTAFRTNVSTRDGTFRLLSGTPKHYVKTAESGRRRITAFCPECGTQIYSSDDVPAPRTHNLRVGTIHQRDQLSPKSAIWTRSALPWVRGLFRDIPQVETRR